jgi:hypothetical protein
MIALASRLRIHPDFANKVHPVIAPGTTVTPGYSKADPPQGQRCRGDQGFEKGVVR